MSTDACQFFYECEGCGILLKPEQGDCCVYCSYGDIDAICGDSESSAVFTDSQPATILCSDFDW